MLDVTTLHEGDGTPHTRDTRAPIHCIKHPWLGDCSLSGTCLPQGVPEQVALERGPCVDGAWAADGAAARGGAAQQRAPPAVGGAPDGAHHLHLGQRPVRCAPGCTVRLPSQ